MKRCERCGLRVIAACSLEKCPWLLISTPLAPNRKAYDEGITAGFRSPALECVFDCPYPNNGSVDSTDWCKGFIVGYCLKDIFNETGTHFRTDA